MRILKSFVFFCIIISFLIIPTISNSNQTPDKTAIMAKTAKLQIPFIENQGQIKDKAVKFYANTFAGNVYVTEKGEIVYGLVSNQPSAVSNHLIKKTNTPKGVFLQTKTSDEQRTKVAAEPRSASDGK